MNKFLYLFQFCINTVFSYLLQPATKATDTDTKIHFPIELLILKYFNGIELETNVANENKSFTLNYKNKCWVFVVVLY